jgi:putative cell wall-binding protein
MRRQLVAVMVAVLLLMSLAVPAGASSPAYDRVVDITFPVAGPNRYIDDYHQDRAGGTRKHRATDIMADHGQTVHAAVGGTIAFITGMNDDPPSYGYMISIAGDDGLTYAYIHLGRQDRPASEAYAPGMAKGVRVARGQHIGYVGSSGNASESAPHLHFEIEDNPDTVDPYGSHRLNPFNSLKDAQARGDVPGEGQPAPEPGPEPEPAPEPAPEPEPEPEPEPDLVSNSEQCIPDADPDDDAARRIAGADRIATAVAVSSAGWLSADDVVVATARDYADALAGGALAAARNAPLLLTEPGHLPDAVAQEIRRLRPGSAWILGGDAAVAPAVEARLADLVPTVQRVAGANRFETAARVASTAHSATSEVVVALGRHREPARAWPDAVAAGALAATPARIPTLLTNAGSLPTETQAALQTLGVTRVFVVGGTSAVHAGVADELRAEGYEVERLAGDDRYATSAVVAAKARTYRTGSRPLVVASGAGYADALSAGALAARVGGPLLLAPPCALEQAPATDEHLQATAGDITHAFLVGGEAAVSERVRWQVGEALHR